MIQGTPSRVGDPNRVHHIPPEADPTGKTPTTPGAKLDAGKVEAALLLDFGRALMAVGRVSTFGAHKYSRGGWQSVEDGQFRYTSALMRHLCKESYEKFDAESQILHAAHAAWNALARLELMLRMADDAQKEQRP
jgi:hypothetical protein